MKRYKVTFMTTPAMVHLGLGTVLESFQGVLYVNAVTNQDAAQKADTQLVEFFSLRKWNLTLEIVNVSESHNLDGLPIG